MSNNLKPLPSPSHLGLQALQSFVLRSQKLYGSGKVVLQKSGDGRRMLLIEDERYKLTDEFDGGNPFCGIERLISKRTNHVLWNGYYHGWLTQAASGPDADVQTIFDFLRQALQRPTAQTIFRGPHRYQRAGLTYGNELDFGAFDCFFGTETICDSAGQVLYYARYGGGLVDLSEDTGEAA